MKVKPADQSAAKWAQRASAAGQAYTDGVKNPKTDWATATSNAADNWGQGVSAAVADGRFAKGVTAAGTAAWATGATNKGANRYGPGVQGAQQKYASGSSKYIQVLNSLQLPPRRPKGDPANQQRAQVVAAALRAAKLGQ